MFNPLTVILLVLVLLLVLLVVRYKMASNIDIARGFKDFFQYLLGGLITIGFFVVVYLLLTQPIPADNRQELDIVLGALVGAFTGGVIGYFFGSSKGSSDKNDTIHKAIEG